MYHYLKGWLSSLCLIAIMSAHSRALFGFGESKTSIAPFVPSSSIDNTSISLAQSAMNLLGQSFESSLIREGDPQGGGFDSMVWNTALSTLSYDLVAAVQSSNDKNQTITTHLQELQQTSSQLTQLSNNYQSQITQSQALMDRCSIDKKSADAAVISAINNNELSKIDALIQSSITAGQCETKHRITINALSLIVKRHNQSIALLKQKSSLIEQHKSTIMQYPEVISDPQIIQELDQISRLFN